MHPSGRLAFCTTARIICLWRLKRPVGAQHVISVSVVVSTAYSAPQLATLLPHSLPSSLGLCPHRCGQAHVTSPSL